MCPQLTPQLTFLNIWIIWSPPMLLNVNIYWWFLNAYLQQSFISEFQSRSWYSLHILHMNTKETRQGKSKLTFSFFPPNCALTLVFVNSVRHTVIYRIIQGKSLQNYVCPYFLSDCTVSLIANAFKINPESDDFSWPLFYQPSLSRKVLSSGLLQETTNGFLCF